MKTIIIVALIASLCFAGFSAKEFSSTVRYAQAQQTEQATNY